ncbi:peptidoglycan-binding protein LysM [Myxococcus sp. MISCRS1]|jgi:LysM repeat protein|uniref:peptidoglycan-binding protein LysM n=1 Tax=Myxococcus TaxID=32 RepID=UPI00114459AF|nr:MULTISPECIES: peptidoglycan-binding protein LysM [unclassified Myxococcus]MBZ4400441.1 peptidoglycan-binding protein LysM [Myxococcus sp. AS-1-15]MBZ4410863.1 peptidoglycan-binding protein LysM [Myxococcus sp. XM-1-1-1]MCY0997187.1 peptidoglycan-binding protein LysM [Myxococcus sp. MISCRS1]BDT32798.1 peptidoglycan-binding protein LysM [Myxococcus sp. MH1]
MRTTLLLFAWLCAAPPDTTVVGPQESLRDVAERALGDASATAELRALNALSSDAVSPGTRLKLPGQERALALKALETARTLVARARSAGGPAEAETRLKEAEVHFRTARYAQASEAANAAGTLVAQRHAPQPSTFSVQVEPDAGTTTVSVTRGPPVRVEAEGVTLPVAPGETVLVEKGRPPSLPPPSVPQPEKPAEGARLEYPADTKGVGLGPVKLSWAAQPGVERYEVEVSREAPGANVLTLSSTVAELKLPRLPAGRYRWTVRAVSASGRSEPSGARRFELVENISVRVRSGPWE